MLLEEKLEEERCGGERDLKVSLENDSSSAAGFLTENSKECSHFINPQKLWLVLIKKITLRWWSPDLCDYESLQRVLYERAACSGAIGCLETC